jgi:predicted porin
VKLTYTGWYASGDDNSGDSDIENFMSVDVDRFDSIIFFEGGYTDDNYFTEAPHILDKGLIFGKVALDYQATEKLKVGGAVLYLMTAEDLTLDNGQKEDKLGIELDAYLSYKLFKDTEFAVNVGYLIADDGMDFFDVAGQRDGKGEDVFRSTARLRYMF